MSKKYSDEDYAKLQYYYNLVSQNRATYFQCFDNYYNYQLKLADTYSVKELENLVQDHYVEWEKLRNLFMNMVLSRGEYEKSLRQLYNFKLVLREIYFDLSVLTDLREGVVDEIHSYKRDYNGVKK